MPIWGALSLACYQVSAETSAPDRTGVCAPSPLFLAYLGCRLRGKVAMGAPGGRTDRRAAGSLRGEPESHQGWKRLDAHKPFSVYTGACCSKPSVIIPLGVS